MNKFFVASLLLALVGCSSAPQSPMRPEPSPCAAGENTYACQVERYNSVNVD